MSFAEFRTYAEELLEQNYLQSEVQTALNDFVTTIIDISKTSGHSLTLDEVRDYLLDEVVAEEADDDRWNGLLRKLISRLRIVDPDNQIFKTMSFGGSGEAFASGFQDVVRSALKREDSQKNK
jgi:hypothetical protein